MSQSPSSPASDTSLGASPSPPAEVLLLERVSADEPASQPSPTWATVPATSRNELLSLEGPDVAAEIDEVLRFATEAHMREESSLTEEEINSLTVTSGSQVRVPWQDDAIFTPTVNDYEILFQHQSQVQDMYSSAQSNTRAELSMEELTLGSAKEVAHADTRRFGMHGAIGEGRPSEQRARMMQLITRYTLRRALL